MDNKSFDLVTLTLMFDLQWRLSYVTLQGAVMKRSHMTGGLLIQSPYNDQQGEKCFASQYFQNRIKSLDVLEALLNMYMYKLK